MKKQIFGLVAAAIALASAGVQTATQTISNPAGISQSADDVKQNKQSDKVPIKQAAQSDSKIIKRMPMFGLNTIMDGGIPPKVYGQNYVRRGTHKRTNKA